MQTISIVYDPDTHGISTSTGYAGATIDNSSTVINVSGIPEGYDARLEFAVVVADNNGVNRHPFIPLEESDGTGVTLWSCTVPDSILSACERTHRLPAQLVITDAESGVVTASKNWVTFNVAPSVNAFNSFVSAYSDRWTRAIISLSQDSETGNLTIIDMNGDEQEIGFSLSSLMLPAENIVGTIPMGNMPEGVKDGMVSVATEADRLNLTASSVQNGDTVFVIQSQLMYKVIDDTALGSENAFQVYRGQLSWGDIDGSIEDQTDLGTILASVENVQPDWTENDSTSDAFILHKPTLGTAAALNAGTQAGNLVPLNANGKLPDEVMPEIALSRSLGTVTEKADLTGLVGQTGDWAVVTDDDNEANNGMYILSGQYTEILDWSQVKTPGAVFSVDGATGAVDLRALRYTRFFKSGNSPYATITGDGSTVDFVIMHNLGAVPVVELYDEEDTRTTATITSTTTQVSISFYSAPTASESYKVVIHA